MDFIGREKELKVLEERYLSGRKEFGVIYGRRRIGKTALIEKFIEGKSNVIFFQAKRTSSYGNLRSFSKAINELTDNDPDFVYRDFEAALDALGRFASKGRVIIAIDEYPYILEQMPSFSSYLQEFIDRASDNVFLLLSGSDVSFLRKEIKDHNSPLYKRRTFEMEIKKLDFAEAIRFLEDFDNEAKCKYLSLLSSYPYYLGAIDHRLSFEDNVKNALFSQYGIFFDLPDQLLSNTFKTQDVYNAILEAIAHRKRTNKEIALYIHEEESKVAKYLMTLLNAEIVERCETFMGNKKTVFYEIKDNLLKFWYSFIFPNLERIGMNGDLVFREMKEKIDLFISREFEKTAILYLEQLNKEGRLVTVFNGLKPYKVEKSALGRSVEIDGLSRQGDYLLVMEAKFRNAEFSLPMFEHLEESVSIFPEKLERVYYIFSKNGFDDDIKKKESDNLHLISLDDMFRA